MESDENPALKGSDFKKVSYEEAKENNNIFKV